MTGPTFPFRLTSGRVCMTTGEPGREVTLPRALLLEETIGSGSLWKVFNHKVTLVTNTSRANTVNCSSHCRYRLIGANHSSGHLCDQGPVLRGCLTWTDTWARVIGRGKIAPWLQISAPHLQYKKARITGCQGPSWLWFYLFSLYPYLRSFTQLGIRPWMLTQSSALTNRTSNHSSRPGTLRQEISVMSNLTYSLILARWAKVPWVAISIEVPTLNCIFPPFPLLYNSLSIPEQGPALHTTAAPTRVIAAKPSWWTGPSMCWPSLS